MEVITVTSQKFRQLQHAASQLLTAMQHPQKARQVKEFLYFYASEERMWGPLRKWVEESPMRQWFLRGKERVPNTSIVDEWKIAESARKGLDRGEELSFGQHLISDEPLDQIIDAELGELFNDAVLGIDPEEQSPPKLFQKLTKKVVGDLGQGLRIIIKDEASEATKDLPLAAAIALFNEEADASVSDRNETYVTGVLYCVVENWQANPDFLDIIDVFLKGLG